MLSGLGEAVFRSGEGLASLRPLMYCSCATYLGPGHILWTGLLTGDYSRAVRRFPFSFSVISHQLGNNLGSSRSPHHTEFNRMCSVRAINKPLQFGLAP